jgi:hypothetical protein
VWGIETSDKYDKYDKKILEKYFINFFLGEGAAPFSQRRWEKGAPAPKNLSYLSVLSGVAFRT